MLLAALLASSSAFAHDCIVDGICYNIDTSTNTAIVTRYGAGNNYSFYKGDVTIPSQISYNSKTYDVTTIGELAFYICTRVTSVTIPISIKTIEAHAFEGCNGLTRINISDLSAWCKIEFESNADPLVSAGHLYLNGIEVIDLVIPEDVTHISGGAFSGCLALTSVTIPNSVTSIGNGAFSSCSGLTSVTIPNSVTSIGGSAFSDCSGLTSVTIGNSVTSIDYGTFFGCTSLSSVTIPKSVTSIGDYAFYCCSGLTSVTIPNSVTSIGYSAFRSCSGLTSVTIPNSVTKIGNGAFRGCSGLTSVTIPNSVTEIGNYAFSGCSSLTSVTIPNSVSEIYGGAFEGCSNLSSVTFDAEKCTAMGSSKYPVFKGCERLSDLTIGEKVTIIPNSAFYCCSGLTSVTTPSSVTEIGNEAFYDCSRLESIIIGTGVLTIGDKAIGYKSDGTYSPVTKVIWLPNTPPKGYENVNSKVNYVANNLYTKLSNKYEYKYLSSMFEVAGIRYVPVSPSERTCDAIDCTYSPNVTKICINKTVSYKGISMSLTDIKPYTCYNNKHITKVTINYDGNIGKYAFTDCSAITSATITANAIGEYAFSSCKSLQGITIPNSVTSMGSSAFSGCSALKYATLGTGLKTINDYTFRNCSSLTSITIPANITKIGNYVFDGCSSLADVYINDRETELSLGSNGSSPMFSDCPLKTVYIGGNITYSTSSNYGYSPFYRNTSLEKVIITDKETEISENEFYGCTGLKYITMGDGIEKIGDWAFSGCSSLDFFRVGSSVKTIGKEAFSDCTAMTKLITTAPVPPTCGSQALDDINKWTCELLVTKESIELYKAAEQWKEFFFISEYDGVDDITVDGGDTADTLYDVYNLQGVRVGNSMRQADMTDVLPRGVYILVSPKGTRKVKI